MTLTTILITTLLDLSLAEIAAVLLDWARQLLDMAAEQLRYYP